MKTLINKAIFKEQMKRFWLLSVFYFAFLFVYGIIPILNTDINRVNYSIRKIVTTLSFNDPLILMSTLAAAVIAVIFTFYYLFDKRATVAMHSYPITKKQLYITNISVGLILFFIPFTLFCLLLAVKPIYVDINKLYDYGISYNEIDMLVKNIADKNANTLILLNNNSAILEFFVKGIVVFLFYYFMILLSAIVSGNIIIFIVNAFILAMLIPALTGIYGDMYLSYNIGIGYYSINNLKNSIMAYTVPLTTMGQPLDILKTLIYIILSMLLAFIAYNAYIRRNEEKSGRAFAFISVQNGFILLTSMGFTYFTKYVMIRIAPSMITSYASLTLGFIIGYMVANMLIERDFNIFYKFKKFPLYALAFLAISVILFGSVNLDLFGLTRLPNRDEIEGIYVNNYSSYYEDNDIPLITSLDVIDMAINLEEEINKNKKELLEFSQQLDYLGYEYNRQAKPMSIDLSYKLKNGKILNKGYIIPLAGDVIPAEISKKTLALLENKDVLISQNPILNIPVEDIAYLNISTPQTPYEITDRTKIKETIDIIRNNLVDEKIAQHTEYINSTEETKNIESYYLSFEVNVKDDELLTSRGRAIRDYGYPVTHGSELEKWIEDNLLK